MAKLQVAATEAAVTQGMDNTELVFWQHDEFNATVIAGQGERERQTDYLRHQVRACVSGYVQRRAGRGT